MSFSGACVPEKLARTDSQCKLTNRECTSPPLSFIPHQILMAGSSGETARVLIGVAGSTRCDFALRASIVHKSEEESIREEMERKRQAQAELDKEMIADKLFGIRNFSAESEFSFHRGTYCTRPSTHAPMLQHKVPATLLEGLDLNRHRPLSVAAAEGGKKVRPQQEPRLSRREKGQHDPSKLPLGAPEMTNAELLKEVLRRDVTRLELGASGFYEERERERGLSAPGLRRRRRARVGSGGH